MAAKFSDIGKIISQALASDKVLDEAGKIAVESIQKRTRLGNGVKQNLGGSHKLPKLKEKTVKNRTLLKKKGQLTGKGATPAKSAVNKSGDMLNDITYTVGNGTLDIKLKSPEQQKKAQNLLSINDNFAFMNVSKAEFNRMIKSMTGKINDILKGIKFDSL